MVIELLAVAIGGGVALAAARVAGRRQRVARSRALMLDGLRTLGEAPTLLRRPDDGDAGVIAGVGPAVSALERELAELGFTTLGDLLGTNGLAWTPMRVMASADHVVHAQLFVEPAGNVSLVSASAAGDIVLSGRRDDDSGFATPPHADVAALPAHTPLPEVVEWHRTRARGLTDRVAYRSLDDVLASHLTTRARTVAWRRTQSPDTLLEADLRGVMGPAGFAAEGRLVMDRLRAPVPQALVIRKRG